MSELSVEERLEKIEERLSAIAQLREGGMLDQHYWAHEGMHKDIKRLRETSVVRTKELGELREELAAVRLAVLKLSSRSEVHPLI